MKKGMLRPRVILGQKERRLIVTFHQTADAMQMEKICHAQGIPGRLIPVPSAISAGCGMCWSAPPEAKDEILAAMRAAGLNAQGLTELEI